MKDILTILTELEIPYIKHEHPAVFTCEEADEHFGKEGEKIEGAHTKNLFLRNKKGDKHYLIVVERRKTANIGELRTAFGESKLSFGSPERLEKYLGVTPGSVTPLGLITDEEKAVEVVIDEDLANFEKVNFHPLRNTATLTIAVKDFERFLNWKGNAWKYMKI